MISTSNRPLRIAVLAHNLRAAGGLSVGRNLLAALAKAAPRHSYFVTIPTGCGYEEICRQFPNCETVVCHPGDGLLKTWYFETVQLRNRILPLRPDVVLALGNRGLLSPPCPQAVLIADAHYSYPRKHYGAESFRNRLVFAYNGWYLGRVLRHTKLLLCQTPVAQRRLVRAYGYKGQTAVCPNAVSDLPFGGEADPSVPQALAPYRDRMKLFCLSWYYAHKNLESLFALFAQFSQELAGVVVVTTIDADQSPLARRFVRSIERFGLQDRIVNVGFIPDAQLASYYRHCHALLLPTFLETFSGTYVEAMRWGLPILTSDLDFAHCVCGDAALYFDPWNVRSMKDAISRLRANPDLGRELTNRGTARLQTMFKSWNEIAVDLSGELTKLARLG
ncbi:MAG: glycosyltransferase [Phycisphaerales bacterium]|nr:MAG: glycosyltransferase [Phycisphaerales bacterium]